MKRLRFWKLTAGGNDFILVEAGAARPRAWRALARRLCDRRRSVGADGLLVVRRGGGARPPRVDYLNADGSRAFCGNGSRCAAWWMVSAGWAGRSFVLDTAAGRLAARLLGPRRVRMGMGDARLLRAKVRVRAGGRLFSAELLDTGVPHAVVRVPGRELGRLPVRKLGAGLRSHRAFGAAGANVDFVAEDGRSCRLRTFERGVEDETWSCGTGAVAAAVALRGPGRAGLRRVRVLTRGGALTVRFRAGTGGVFAGVSLEGPVEPVCEGTVEER